MKKSGMSSLKRHVGEDDIAQYRQLFNGVRSGDTHVVRTLLTQGMKVNLKGPRGATPLHIAARFHQAAMVDVLLAHGADPMARDDSGNLPFDKVRAGGGGASQLTLRLSQSMTMDPALSPPPPQLPAQRAAPMLHVGGTTSSTTATAAAYAAAPRPLPPGSGSTNTSSAKHESVWCRRLLESAFRGEAHLLEQILSKEPRLVSRVGPRGATALHVASRYGHPASVALLLKYGADPLVRDEKGNTPIDKARQMRQQEVLALLSMAAASQRSPASTHPLTHADGSMVRAPPSSTLLVENTVRAASKAVPLELSGGGLDKRPHTLDLRDGLLEHRFELAAVEIADNTEAAMPETRSEVGARSVSHNAATAAALAAADAVAQVAEAELETNDKRTPDAGTAAAVAKANEATARDAAGAALTTVSSADEGAAEGGNHAGRCTSPPLVNDAVPSSTTASAVGELSVVLYDSTQDSVRTLEMLTPAMALDDANGGWLIGVSGAATGRSVGVTRRQHGAESMALRIGRAPSCEVPLNDVEVSGQHAMLWWAQTDGADCGGELLFGSKFGSTFAGSYPAANKAGRGCLYAADRPGSFNGTFLRLASEKEVSHPYPLKTGDTIIIGDFAICLEALEVQDCGSAARAPEAKGRLSADSTRQVAPWDCQDTDLGAATCHQQQQQDEVEVEALVPNGSSGGDENGSAIAHGCVGTEVPFRHGARGPILSMCDVPTPRGSRNGAHPNIVTRLVSAICISKHRGTPSPPAVLQLPADDSPVTIGRANTNSITLAGDQSVSASHAELRRTNEGTWAVRDLGSSNGTALRLSAERVASRAYRLRLGHRLALGSGPKASEFVLHRFRHGVAERKGRRPTMEDAWVTCDPLPAPAGLETAWPGWCSFFAVYDGHAGAEASAFAKVHLHRHVLCNLAARVEARRLEAAVAEVCDGGGRGGGGNGGNGGSSKDGFEVTELPSTSQAAQAMRVTGKGTDGGCGDGVLTVEDLADALREAFLTTDELFMCTSASSAGSTAVAAIVTATHIVVANAGDSRACLWRKGRVLPLSVDHKPDRPDELQRIREAGGWVSHGRVLHILAVSRSLGDRDFKFATASAAGMPITADLVSARPEVRICRVQQGDELLLACDGLWDVLSGEGAFDYLHAHGASDNPQRAVSQLVQAADEQFNSLDNITACYVRLSTAE